MVVVVIVVVVVAVVVEWKLWVNRLSLTLTCRGLAAAYDVTAAAADVAKANVATRAREPLREANLLRAPRSDIYSLLL